MVLGSIPSAVFTNNSSNKNTDTKTTTAIDKIIFRNNKVVQILNLLLDSEKVNFSKMSYPVHILTLVYL
jgi:hypothetical protein